MNAIIDVEKKARWKVFFSGATNWTRGEQDKIHNKFSFVCDFSFAKFNL